MRRHDADQGKTPTPREQLAGAPLFDGQPKPWDFSHVRPPIARTSDPETSHAGARRAFGDAKAQQAMIVACLRGAGAAGMTAKEIAAALGEGWTNVIVSRRMAALRDAGELVSYDGKKHHGVTRMLTERQGCAVHRAIVNGQLAGGRGSIGQPSLSSVKTGEAA